MLNEPKKKNNSKFSNVLYIQYCVCIAIMLVETKLAMIHLNVPNVFDLYTIYSITHIGMYMRQLTATRLNQNVLRSVNFHAMTSRSTCHCLPSRYFMSLKCQDSWYILRNGCCTVWIISTPFGHIFIAVATLPSIKIYFNMHQCLHYTISQYLSIHQFGITPMN